MRSRPQRLSRPKNGTLYRVRCACRRWPTGDAGWFDTTWEAGEAHADHAERRPGHHPLPPDMRAAGAPPRLDDGRPVVCLACGDAVGRELSFLGSLRCVECRGTERPLDPALTVRWLARGAPF
jgi:hypothetical protein